MPRAGHHYLVRLLRDVLGGELRYCEFYTPPACCRRIPCQLRDGAGVVYQKNHDFDLTLPTELPGALVLVQTREPLAEALSDHELWRAVDPLLAADPQFLPLWLGRKAAYIERFLRKWVAHPPAGSLVVAYEDLQRQPVATLVRVLDALGRPIHADVVAAVVERQRGNRGGGVAFLPRPADRGVPSGLFEDFARLLAGSTPVEPLLALAAEAFGAELDGDQQRALELWHTAGDRFSENPHVGAALWEQAQRAGQGDLANCLATTLARREPAWPGSSLQLANDLARRGELTLALALLDRVLGLDPEHPPSHMLRAHCLAGLGRQEDSAQAAASFTRGAASCPLLLHMTPDQRRLRADFRGSNQLENWQSAERFLADRPELALEHAIAREIAAALASWSGEAPRDSGMRGRSNSRRAAHEPADVLVAAAQPLFADAPAEPLAADLAHELARGGHRTDRIRLPWASDRQGNLADLEALLLLDPPGSGLPGRRIVALDIPAWIWASPAPSQLWLADEPAELPADRAAAWRATLAVRGGRGFAISALAAALARRRYGLDLLPLYPPPRPCRVTPGPAQLLLRWHPRERPRLAMGALALLPGRSLLVADLPTAAVAIWRALAIEEGVADRVMLSTGDGASLVGSCSALLVTVAGAVDPSGVISALGAGRASIVTADAGAALELIDDRQHGRIVAARVETLAEAVAEALGDDVLRARWEAAAASRGHSLGSWASVVSRLLDAPR